LISLDEKGKNESGPLNQGCLVFARRTVLSFFEEGLLANDGQDFGEVSRELVWKQYGKKYLRAKFPVNPSRIAKFWIRF